jgi:hypothetical protein
MKFEVRYGGVSVITVKVSMRLSKKRDKIVSEELSIEYNVV